MPHPLYSYRRLRYGLLPAVLLLLAGEAPANAQAVSQGCLEINAGHFNAMSGNLNQIERTATGFGTGDTVTITFTPNSGTPYRYTLSETGEAPRSAAPSGAMTITRTIERANSALTLQFRTEGLYFDTVTVTAACVPSRETGPLSPEAASIRSFREAQGRASLSALAASASTMSDVVSGSIGAGFGGGKFFAAAPGYITLNLGEGIAAKENAARNRELFRKLRMDERLALAATRQPVPVQRPWTAWATVRGSWLSGGPESTGSQINALSGVGYRVAPDTILGVMAGSERFDYGYSSAKSGLIGEGTTLGSYSGWRLTPALTLTTMAAWSGLTYKGRSDGIGGNFSGSRYLVGAGLTGRQTLGPVTLSPEARFYGAYERHGSFTASNGTSMEAMDVFLGRTTLGARASITQTLTPYIKASPYAGVYANLRYSQALDLSQPNTEPMVAGAWSALTSASLGVNFTGRRGASLNLGGQVSDIGASSQSWSATGRLSIGF